MEELPHLSGISLHLHHILHDAYSKILEEYSLVPRQFGLLKIGCRMSFSQTQSAKFILLDKNTVGVMIDALASRGLLERKQNPKNRRENIISTTKKGKELVNKLEPMLLKAQREVFSFLKDKDYEIFCSYMQDVMTNIFLKEE